MNDRASQATGGTAPAPATMELRHAQRAFSMLIDERASAGEFRTAQLRAATQRTLSALSADDRTRLTNWVSLQLATGRRIEGEAPLALLSRIDARLGARVGRLLPEIVEALERHAGAERIVAA